MDVSKRDLLQQPSETRQPDARTALPGEELDVARATSDHLIVPTSTTSPGYRAALGVSEFRAIALAGLISLLGDGVAYLAVSVLIYADTGSALKSAATFSIAFLPYLVGGAFFSGLVDRLAGRRLMIGCDAISAGLVVVLSLLGSNLIAVLCVLFAVGCLSPVRAGASGPMVAELLPGDLYIPGRSVQRIFAQLAQLFGAAFGGVLVAVTSSRTALVFDAATFVVSAALVAGFVKVRARPVSEAPERPARLAADSLRGGLQVFRVRPVRETLIFSWLVALSAVAPEGLGAPAVAEARVSTVWVGIWLMAIPLGIVVGDLLVVTRLSTGWRERVSLPLAISLVAILALFSLNPPFPVQLVLLIVSGMCSAYALGIDKRLLQLTPPSLLARMYVVNGTGLMVAQGVGFAAGGLLADVLDVHRAVGYLGAIGLVEVAILYLRARRSQFG